MYRILVVDDEENIREVIKEYCRVRGSQVSEACDGMQAIEMVKNNDYDIIIMDVMMPRLDGYSACKETARSSRSRYLCCPPAARSTTSCSV